MAGRDGSEPVSVQIWDEPAGETETAERASAEDFCRVVGAAFELRSSRVFRPGPGTVLAGRGGSAGE